MSSRPSQASTEERVGGPAEGPSCSDLCSSNDESAWFRWRSVAGPGVWEAHRERLVAELVNGSSCPTANPSAGSGPEPSGIRRRLIADERLNAGIRASCENLITTRARYRLGRRLGAGSVGQVWEALDTCTGERFAAKLLHEQHASDEKVIARVLREARLTSALRHESIVTMHDAGIMEDGRPFLIMEYLEGRTLAQRCRRQGAFPWLRALAILEQIAAGLATAHEAGIVHRDLHAGNVFLLEKSASGVEVKLLDFGLAKSLLLGDLSGQLTRTGEVVGAPSVTSPEQIRGQAVDQRVDVYAFGCLAFQMLAGHPPYCGGTAERLMFQHLTSPPPAPKILDADREMQTRIHRFIARALAKQPEQRFRDGSELLVALRELDAQRSRGRRYCWVRIGYAGVATAVGAVLGVGGVGSGSCRPANVSAIAPHATRRVDPGAVRTEGSHKDLSGSSDPSWVDRSVAFELGPSCTVHVRPTDEPNGGPVASHRDAVDSSLVVAGHFTIRVEFRTMSVTPQLLFGSAPAPEARHTLSLRLDEAGVVEYAAEGNGTGWAMRSKDALGDLAGYNDGRWHVVVATMGPRTMALYLDGTRVAYRTGAGPLARSDGLDPQPRRISTDAVVRSCGEFEGAVRRAEIWRGAGVFSRRVFVSSKRYDGGLDLGDGGLEAASARCQSLASKAALGGRWHAWMSAHATSASEIVSRRSDPYVLVDGSWVASDWEDLVDGTLLHPINLDEYGHEHDDAVWTGTSWDGFKYVGEPGRRRRDSAEQHCRGWRTSTERWSGRVGRSSETDVGWTDAGEKPCHTQNRIYCIEASSGWRSPLEWSSSEDQRAEHGAQ